MKKIYVIIYILILVIISGCNLSKESVNNDSKKNESVITKPMKKDNSEGTKSSLIGSQGHRGKSPDIKSYLLRDGKILLKGKIKDDLNIHMELIATNKEPSVNIGDLYWNNSLLKNEEPIKRYVGRYYYDKKKKWIRVEALFYSNDYLSIIEFNEKKEANGFFGGFVTENQGIQGKWSDKEDSVRYPFCIIPESSTLEMVKLKFSKKKMGNYIQKLDETSNAFVEIYFEVDNKFKFEIESLYNDNIGEIGGVAFYTDSSKKRAIYVNSTENIKLIFTFRGNEVKVQSNRDISEYGGVGVTFTGIFKRES